MLRAIIYSGLFLVYTSLNAQNTDTLRLFVADQTLYAGNSYSFPVYSSNFDSIAGIQFTLSLSTEYVDSADLYFDNLVPFNRDYYWKKEWNQMGFSWSTQNGKGVSVSKDTSLFNLYLSMQKDITVKDLIKLMYKGYVSPECFKGINNDIGPYLGISLEYNTKYSAIILTTLNQETRKNELKLFPNPSKPGAVIELKNDTHFSSYQWFDQEGKVISMRQSSKNNRIIAPTQLNNGIYFIHLYDSDNKLTSTRIEIIN